MNDNLVEIQTICSEINALNRKIRKIAHTMEDNTPSEHSDQNYIRRILHNTIDIFDHTDQIDDAVIYLK